MTITPANVAIALGSNLGDRRQVIRAAFDELVAGGVGDARLSSMYATVPVDCEVGAPEFLNAAMIGMTSLKPQEVLTLCLATEMRLGRRRADQHDSSRYVSRVIDLDLLLYGQVEIRSKSLVLPHPRMTERMFVLEPLAELAADWVVSSEAGSVSDCLKRLRGD